MSPTSKSPAATPRRVRSVKKRSHPVVGISARFPVAYMKIIESEADWLGLGRGQFLTMLIKRASGALRSLRPEGGQSYILSDDELKAHRAYLWELDVEQKKVLDDLRLGMGNLTIVAYMIHLINSWLGAPQGLERKKG